MTWLSQQGGVKQAQVDATVAAAVSNEAQIRSAADQALQDAIDAVEAGASGVGDQLDSEIQARIAGDSALQSEIDAAELALANETQDRINADSALQINIDSVESAAAAVGDQLDAEVIARTNADAALQSEIDAAELALANETQARISGDSALQSAIDAVELEIANFEVHPGFENKIIFIEPAAGTSIETNPVIANALASIGTTNGFTIEIGFGEYREVGPIVFNEKWQLQVEGPNAAGTTAATIKNGITVQNSNGVRLSNLQVEGVSSISSRAGLGLYFRGVQFLGNLTVGGTGGFMIFNECDIGANLTIPATFAGVVYFVRCSFSNAAGAYALSQTSAAQVIMVECTGIPNTGIAKASFSGITTYKNNSQALFLNGIAISNIGATSGQVLKFNGTLWAPAADSATDSTKVLKSGDTMTGQLSLTSDGSNPITPTAPAHAANKKYVDDAVAAGGGSGEDPTKLPLTGGTLSGPLYLEDGSGNPIAISGASAATNKLYVDTAVNAVEAEIISVGDALDAEILARTSADNTLAGEIDGKVSKAGDSMSGQLSLISGATPLVPTAPEHAVNKAYADSISGTQYVDNSTTNNNVVETQYVDNSTTINSVVQPGEIRSFAGEVPSGWELVGDTAANAFDHSFASSVGAMELGATAWPSTTGVNSSRNAGLVFVGANKIAMVGQPSGTAFSDVITDLSSGTNATGASRQQSQFNIAARTADGKALFSGGMGTGSANWVATTFTVDEFGVQTNYAAAPVVGGGGAGGQHSATEFCFFTSTTSVALGGTISLASYKFNISTNSWSSLPNAPRSHISGAACFIASENSYVVIGSEVIADGGFVDVYDLGTNSWDLAPFTLPAGIDAIRGVSKAQLADGRWLLLARYTSENGAATWVNTNRLFILSNTGIELGPRVPGAFAGVTVHTNFVADNGLATVNAPVYILKHARSSTVGLESAMLLNETSQQFLTKRAIHYARKL